MLIFAGSTRGGSTFGPGGESGGNRKGLDVGFEGCGKVTSIDLVMMIGCSGALAI